MYIIFTRCTLLFYYTIKLKNYIITVENNRHFNLLIQYIYFEKNI